MKKILLIGDSISLYYSPYLATYLSGKDELHNKEGRREAFLDLDRPTGGNGGDSSMVLEYLRELEVNRNFHFNLFVFNCGLHDIKRLNDTNCVISEEDYKNNLQEIITLTKKNRIKTVFITTTPVEDERHNSRKQLGFTRYDHDVKKYNSVALSVMKEYDIPVIDLGAFSRNLTGELFIDHVHYCDEVRKIQAAYIFAKLEEYI